MSLFNTRRTVPQVLAATLIDGAVPGVARFTTVQEMPVLARLPVPATITGETLLVVLKDLARQLDQLKSLSFTSAQKGELTTQVEAVLKDHVPASVPVWLDASFQDLVADNVKVSSVLGAIRVEKLT